MTAIASLASVPQFIPRHLGGIAPPPGLEQQCIPSKIRDSVAPAALAVRQRTTRRYDGFRAALENAIVQHLQASTNSGRVPPPGVWTAGGIYPSSSYLEKEPSTPWIALGSASGVPSDTSTKASTGDSSSCMSEQEVPLDTADQVEFDKPKCVARQFHVEYFDKESAHGGIHLSWPIGASKIRGTDAQIISPSFELFPGVSCKLMIKAKTTGVRKGQASFKKAKGHGFIQLKCEAAACADLPPGSFSLAVMATGIDLDSRRLRGPVTLDFSNASVCGLPKHEEDWDFSSAIDHSSNSFTVHLCAGPMKEPDALPGASLAPQPTA